MKKSIIVTMALPVLLASGCSQVPSFEAALGQQEAEGRMGYQMENEPAAPVALPSTFLPDGAALNGRAVERKAVPAVNADVVGRKTRALLARSKVRSITAKRSKVGDLPEVVRMGARLQDHASVWVADASGEILWDFNSTVQNGPQSPGDNVLPASRIVIVYAEDDGEMLCATTFQ